MKIIALRKNRIAVINNFSSGGNLNIIIVLKLTLLSLKYTTKVMIHFRFIIGEKDGDENISEGACVKKYYFTIITEFSAPVYFHSPLRMLV